MGQFLTSLCAGVAVPVGTAGAAAVWKLLGKNAWDAYDFLVAFELLIAGIAVQLTSLANDVFFLAGPAFAQPHRLWEALAIRLVLLLALGLVILPGLAVGLRYHTRQNVLTQAAAFRLSWVSGITLMAIFLINFYLYDVV